MIGSPVKRLIFDLYGDQLRIVMKRIIVDAITNYEPRVVLQDVIINDSIDNNAVYISIVYRLVNTEQPYEVTITLERTR